ncbi:MAG: hypothetical protein RIB60_04905 [Phycisphaerales bacterium]
MLRGIAGLCTLGLFCAATGLAGAGEKDESQTRREIDRESGFIGLYDTAPLSSMPREPMWYLNCFSAERDRREHPQENKAGVRGNWRGAEGLDWFMSEIRRGYALGARAFWVNRPMGTDGNSHVPAAGWLAIPAEKRLAMQERINEAILEEFDEEIRIYYFIGSWMTDPRDLRGYHEDYEDELYRLGDDSAESLHATRVTLGGLMSAGATGFGIDASAPLRCREHYIQFAEQLRRPPFNLHVIGEALPVIPKRNGRGGVEIDANGDFMVDQDAIERMAWVGIAQYMNYRFHHRVFDPDKTRIFKWYAFPSVYRDLPRDEQRRMIAWDHEHGYIVITQDEFLFTEALAHYQQTHRAVEENNEKFRHALVD